VACLVVAVWLAGCGGSTSSTGASPAARPDPTFEHVHGLGINPRDGALYIATHTGLFRAARGVGTVSRVGATAQDVMGFTVIGPDRFLGSGHPDPQESTQPPNLGLIRSDSAGRSWTPVSLAGAADFHVLRSVGDRIAGFNGLTGRLMVSADGGETWTAHRPPGPLVDLAIAPRRPGRLVASTDQALLFSPNGGRGWKTLRPRSAGLLAWPRANRLFWLDARGAVRVSSDSGISWRDRGMVGGRPAALTSAGGDLYAALEDGTVKRSQDDGATWSIRARP